MVKNAMGKENYLREEFTSNIIKSLIEKRISINLIGAKGMGKTRLLEDICGAGLSDAKIVIVDLKSYDLNYAGLLREIHRQLELKEKIPERLAQLFDGFENFSYKYLLLFDNYDALLDNPWLDTRYGKEFFHNLNAIKNKKNFSILCTTCRPHRSMTVLMGDQSFGNSWLDLNPEELEQLHLDQVKSEINRRLHEPARQWMKSNTADWDRLVKCIHSQPFPYARLSFLTGKLNNRLTENKEIKFKKRLKKWLKSFNRFTKNSLPKKIRNFRKRVLVYKMNSGLKMPKVLATLSAATAVLLAILKKKCGL
jgi:hypothetical protein